MRLSLHISRIAFMVAVVGGMVSCDRSATKPPSQSVVKSAEASAEVTEEEWSLEEADRKYLWDLEHHSNVLVKHGFGVVVQALQDQDAERLTSVFASEFTGHVVDQATEVTFEEEALVANRQQQPAEMRSVNAVALVAVLLEKRRIFSSVPKVRFDVKVIVPQNRHDLEAAWDATCVMRMSGEAQPNQPTELSMVFTMTHERPTKERMEQPGWIHECAINQIAMSQASHPLFREVEYNINRDPLFDNWRTEDGKSQNTGGIYACDFNRDGCVDLFVTDINPAGTALYRGLPEGGFEDVTAAVRLTAVRKALPEINAAFVDLDGDGWEDLVFATGVIFRNSNGQKFLNVTPQSNLRLHTKGVPSSSISVADFDRDGKMDLYVARRGGLPTSWLEDTKENPETNLLLRNTGNFSFENVTGRSGTGGDARSTFTSLWLNANKDLWPDLYVINEFGDGALYINEAGVRFRQIDVDPATDDFGSMGATCGDIDNDGNIDLYNASMYSKAGSRVTANLPSGVYPADVNAKLKRLISGSEFYQNEGSLKFTAHGEDYQLHDVGWAWGPTLADFNNDGWLDLFATAGYMSRDRAKPDG